jgi:hypothetical protein
MGKLGKLSGRHILVGVGTGGKILHLIFEK